MKELRAELATFLKNLAISINELTDTNKRI